MVFQLVPFFRPQRLRLPALELPVRFQGCQVSEFRDEKFRPFLTVEQAARLVDALGRDAQVVEDPSDRQRVSRDSDDDYLVALARAASADVLVTGDGDLLALDLPNLGIVTPRDFIERLP